MPIENVFPILSKQLQTVLAPQALQYIIDIAPLLLAVTLFYIMWPLWVRYIRAKNFLSIAYTVLELRLPKDTFKSPLAMEVFLNALHNTSNGNLYAQFWKGETRPWYSLEIVSIEGKVKFYIWTEDRRKAGVMSALYSQYPQIEIYEHGDYTKGVQFDPKTMKMWAGELIFTMSDPYPIKTYVDYGLDKDPKEEFKVDPILPLIEFLGSVGPNQQVWIQILIQAHTKSARKPGHLWKKTDPWIDSAKKLVNEMILRDPKTKIAGEPDEETGQTKGPVLSKGEKDIIEAIERSITKHPFDCGIRALYFGKKDFFNGAFGAGGVVSSFKQFSAAHLNGFKPNGDKWTLKLSYPWQDYKDIRKNNECRTALKAFKRRSFFYAPFDSKPMVMNTEELATIYHFPGSVAATPNLDRVPSKKSDAPANLPI